MLQDNYTTFETSKELAKLGCKIKSDYAITKDGDFFRKNNGDKCLLSDNHAEKCFGEWYYCYDILNDICCRHATYFLGDEKMFDCPAYLFYATTILKCLQEKDKELAESELLTRFHILIHERNK